MKKSILYRIKISRFKYEGKDRYLAEIDDGGCEMSFSEPNKKALLKRMVREI